MADLADAARRRRRARWRRRARGRARRPRRGRGLVRPEVDLPRPGRRRCRRDHADARRLGRHRRPAGARRADPHRARRRRRGRPAAAERGSIIGEGANTRPEPVQSRRQRRVARSCSPRRRAPSPSATACEIDVIEPERATELGHGHVHGRRPGQRQPAADDRHALRRGRGAATRSAVTWPSSARASASTPAASASSRPTGWKR